MTDRGARAAPGRRRSRLVTAVAAILALVVALLVGYALWTVSDNTLTPSALDQGHR